ncbi:hypothetical protein KI387_007664, partial [Taxus chinensis]
MIVEVEGNDIGHGGRDDGSYEILGEKLTSTTSVTDDVQNMALEIETLERDEPPITNEIFFGTVW